jgi:hypothetical protein
MRKVAGFSFVLCFTTGLWAQGSVVHPGGGASLPGYTRSLGSVVNPGQGGLRVPGSRGGSASNGRVVYAYPVYLGGYYSTPFITNSDDSAAAAAGPAPAGSNVTVIMPPQQPVTPVIINYNYGGAVPVPPPPDRAQAQAPSDEDNTTLEATHYLIAFKDHTIYAATAYWVDGDTIHYFTSGNVHNQASLALVDRDFTERLNKEAGVEVKLPPAAK